jgi:hypothetical protein
VFAWRNSPVSFSVFSNGLCPLVARFSGAVGPAYRQFNAVRREKVQHYACRASFCKAF